MDFLPGANFNEVIDFVNYMIQTFLNYLTY